MTIDSPPLPEGYLEGDVFVGQQLSRDPTSGEEYRIFVDAESARYGISVRLIGKVSADPVTGQLTTTIADTPQVPFSSFVLDFDGGPRAVAQQPADLRAEHDRGDDDALVGQRRRDPRRRFALSRRPGGGECAKTMAERPFAPSFAARPKATRPAPSARSRCNIARPDGQQELKGVDVTLPPGMTGKLAGIPYCPEAALAAAAASGGGAERAPARAARRRAWSAAPRSTPAPARRRCRIDGKVFLSGPYNGAPLSLAVVTPATAGPFDLGTVVVRVALFVDPETAQIHAVSDPIPDVYGGTQLSVRSVDVDDRPQGLHPQPDQLRAARPAPAPCAAAAPTRPTRPPSAPSRSAPLPDQRAATRSASGRS